MHGQPWTLSHEPSADFNTALIHFSPSDLQLEDEMVTNPRKLRIYPEKSPGDQFVVRLDSNAIATRLWEV